MDRGEVLDAGRPSASLTSPGGTSSTGINKGDQTMTTTDTYAANGWADVDRAIAEARETVAPRPTANGWADVDRAIDEARARMLA
jgi:hypothetical protein